MTTLEPILRKHPFFADLADEDLKLICSCAKNVRFNVGDVVAQEGQSADEFYLIREGRIAVAMPSPSGGRLKIDTLDAGEVAGWSWLFPPYIWHFDLIAVTPIRALSMDGLCLRRKCDEDPRLGYDLMKRFSRVMSERLSAARLQAIDLYGSKASNLNPIPTT
jgi:CRP-like cAMP-binding protein